MNLFDLITSLINWKLENFFIEIMIILLLIFFAFIDRSYLRITEQEFDGLPFDVRILINNLRNYFVLLCSNQIILDISARCSKPFYVNVWDIILGR